MKKLFFLTFLMGIAMLPSAHGDTPPLSPAAHTPSVLPPPIAALADKTAVDTRIRRYITPTRLVWQSQVKGASLETPEKLLQLEAGR